MGAITKQKEMEALTAQSIKEGNLVVYTEIYNLGAQEARDELNTAVAEAHEKGRMHGNKEGEIVGAKSELERILAVEAQLVPGHEKLIAKLVADGTTTGPEAAVEVIQADKSKRKSGLNTLEKESPDAIDNSLEEKPEKTEAKTAKEKWDADEKLRAEFKDDFAAFEAYAKSVVDGNVKVLGSK